MDASSNGHKEVPDGVGEGNATITLEEHHAQAVEEATSHQLQEPISVRLWASTEVPFSYVGDERILPWGLFLRLEVRQSCTSNG